MSQITFDEKTYPCKEDESVLDSLLRQGKEIPFSCRNGVCHVCLMRATDGTPPADSQNGLSDRLIEKNYFLPCKCKPQSDLAIAKPRSSDLTCLAVVQEKEMLSEDICRIALETAVEIYYHAGQFVNLSKDPSTMRSYSLASVPHQDYFLDLHVRRHDRGTVSRWLVDDLQIGDEIELVRPQGENYYQAQKTESMLLVATGTGLAPVIGIARDALHTDHTGQIFLYHGAANEAGLYAHKKLLELSEQFPNFHYQPCLINERSVQQAVTENHQNLTGWWIHLSGNPHMVEELEKLALELGGEADKILADPFSMQEFNDPATSTQPSESGQSSLHLNETPYPAPAPDLWEALEQGTKLNQILDDFYNAVFEDPLLLPYFKNSTKQRAKEKAYSFYRRIISGDRVFMGDRPLNAHHWMVISNKIFDHREKLLKSTMIKHGLAPDMIKKWQKMEESYRSDIVKDAPRGRIVDGVELPAEGYDKITLSIGGMCDACHAEIAEGTEVNYHLRTGEVFCPACFGKQG